MEGCLTATHRRCWTGTILITGGSWTFRDMTGRKQAVEALRISEEKFSKAFQLSPDAISMFRPGNGQVIIEINESPRQRMPLVMQGRSWSSDIRHWNSGLIQDPAIREKVLDIVKEHGGVREMEIHALNRQGENLTLLHTAEPVFELNGRKCLLRIFA